LWAWSDVASIDKEELSLAQATALVQFIAERYGLDKPSALLRAIDQASSLAEALKASGLSYADITAHWMEWLAKSERS
jgi:molybdenum-dependent DNA-binding transcriptional regulator ModE